MVKFAPLCTDWVEKVAENTPLCMDFAREFIHKGVFFTKTDPFTSLWFVGLHAALPAAACRVCRVLPCAVPLYAAEWSAASFG